jgi:single-stranded-DNA-specific exonuclease
MAVWRIRNRLPGRLLEQVNLSRQDTSKEKVCELPMLQKAILALKESLTKPIAVFGDYDCDGICGAFVMKKMLERVGANVAVRLPTREEGYGIKPQHVIELKEKGIKTIITVDNGITAFEAVKAAKENGIRIIVTDHHEPKNRLPDCITVDPKLRKDAFRDYSGTGVAYIVGEKLLESMSRTPVEGLMSLVSLATVVDMVPIKGPNFTLARKGLLEMRERPAVGIQALMDVAGIKRLNGYAFGWQIGPRINAAGRVDDPVLAYKLLETEDREEAVKLAEELNKINIERQEMIEVAVQECMTKYDGSMFPFFISSCPHGVAGIVAGNIANTVRRPVIVGSVSSDGVVKASGRSIGDFSILWALMEAQKRCGLPEKYGGHKKACGLEIELNDVPKLQAVLNDIANERLTIKDITEWLDIDGVINGVPPVAEVEELDELEPHGEENPEPVFLYNGRLDRVKKGERWQLVNSGGIKFFYNPEIELNEGVNMHIALTPYINEFNGEKEVMAKVKEIKEKIYTREALLTEYKKWYGGQNVEGGAEAIFQELGLAKSGPVVKKELLNSETFRKYGMFVILQPS